MGATLNHQQAERNACYTGAAGGFTHHLVLQHQLLSKGLHVADVLHAPQAGRDELCVGMVLAHGVHEHLGATVVYAPNRTHPGTAGGHDTEGDKSTPKPLSDPSLTPTSSIHKTSPSLLIR
jgi:hypothetical protein